MIVDIHTHTSRYSLCSTISPEELIKEEKEAGVDAVVITEHDKVWPDDEIKELAKNTGNVVKIFTGQEVTTAAGHVLVYGCKEEFEYNIAIGELSQVVSEAGGVIFPSHPFRYIDLDYYRENVREMKVHFSFFDGIEFLNGNQSIEQNKFALNFYKTLDIAGIGGSDAHSKGMAGKYVTEFKSDIDSSAELVEALKGNNFRPVKNKKKKTKSKV